MAFTHIYEKKRLNDAARMLMTTNELIQYLRIGKTTFYHLKRWGELPPAIRIGGQLFWIDTSVQVWLQNREEPIRIDPVYSERAQKAAIARRTKKNEEQKVQNSQKQGRPTKKDKVEGRKR